MLSTKNDIDMERNEQEFDGVRWNAADLISCKQAMWILMSHGWDLKTLQDFCNFGSLWVEAVWEEYHGVCLG